MEPLRNDGQREAGRRRASCRGAESLNQPATVRLLTPTMRAMSSCVSSVRRLTSRTTSALALIDIPRVLMMPSVARCTSSPIPAKSSRTHGYRASTNCTYGWSSGG